MKLTFRKIAEDTLRKAGRPLTPKEIWSESERLGTRKDYVSKGKTPDATIGAHIYFSMRDDEGIFTKIGNKPARYGLSEFRNSVSRPEPPFFNLIGTNYSGRGSVYQDFKDNKVVATGFSWKNNLSHLYGLKEAEIKDGLKEFEMTSSEYSALKTFLRLKPGDMVALKSSGQPKAGKPHLHIIAYAMVVERDGRVYWHDPENLGHCINVEFIKEDLSIDLSVGGYGKTIHRLSEKDIINKIFENGTLANELNIRKGIRKRRSKRKGTAGRKTGKELRKGSEPYIANLKHNEIQEMFYKYLVSNYPEDRLTMEEDFIDIKRQSGETVFLYEVKPYAWAEDCIRAGLGQLLSYASQLKTTKKIKIVVVGPYKPVEEERDFIEFVKDKLSISFEYIAYNLEPD